MKRCFLLALAFLASPAAAQVVSAPSSSVDTSTFATKAQVQAAQDKADAASSAAAASVKTVNGNQPNTSGALTLPIPTASTAMPPAVADTGSIGTQTSVYAIANHTHASKARKARSQSAVDGSLTYVFETPFGAGVVPRCSAVAETAAGVTDVYNVQINGTPTNVQAVFLVNRFQRSVASLLGLTILSVPAAPGATWVHVICLEP